MESGLLLVEGREGRCIHRQREKRKSKRLGLYHGVDEKRNRVGVILKEEFVWNVLEVKRV